VTVEEEIKIATKLTHLLRAVVSRGQNGDLTARLTGVQSSAALTSMARANALLIVPDKSPRVAKGSKLNALMLDQSLEETSAFSL
jgi:molybdopterin biosynthesis enzyme